jgi:hypothetical protein
MELIRDGGCSPDAGHPNCVKRMRHISVHLFLEEIIATCWNKWRLQTMPFEVQKIVVEMKHYVKREMYFAL